MEIMTEGSADRAADTEPVVLVVDDEKSLADVLVSVLVRDGWRASAVYDGNDAVRAARDLKPDVIVLDVMLPDIGGLDVLQQVRARDPGVSVLFLTAQDEVEHRVAGLKAGGDDYVTKPFSLDEVLARLHGLLRRSGHARSRNASVLTISDLELDEDAHEVSRGGERIELTRTEFELLRYLMLNQRRVLSKSELLDNVWNYDFGGRAHVVELYISYLRKKIDATREPLIHTVRGAGYVIRPAA
jgi:two-component system OmpR family response regulator